MDVRGATAPLSITRPSTTRVEISWPTLSGPSYQLQSNTDLSSTWVDVGIPLLGSGGDLPVTLRILQPEPSTDTLIINGLGGTNTFGVGGGVSALIGVTTNQ